mmetsp:Transcript_17951/g.24104  ORF Transcript_17951/g.24104 Transcript_17951/m.24104 type:complete len:175 (-) Transcript_17951:555-1079(-)
MPVAHERESPNVLELLRKFTNKASTESSGPSLRQMKRTTGEVIEAFPKQLSMDNLRGKTELVDVVEATLSPEIGTGGRPRIKPEPLIVDYSRIDLYSTEVLSEEILFQGRLNKFQAGFKNSFNPKWVVVTRSAFRYYKNMEASVQNASKPLLAIPMYALDKCTRVNFDLGLAKT